VRITLRLIISLVLAVAAVAAIFAYQQARQEKERQRDELERRSRLLADSLRESVEPLLEQGTTDRLPRLVEKFGNRERLDGVAVYDAGGVLLTATSSLAKRLEAPPAVVTSSLEKRADASAFESLNGRDKHVYAQPLGSPEKPLGALAIFHDAAFIRAQLARLWRGTFERLLVQMCLIVVVTLFIVRWSITGPIAQMAEWMKKLAAGEDPGLFAAAKEDIFSPIAREVAKLANNLATARTAAEAEARLRQSAEALWTPDRLKEHIRLKLKGQPLFVISNREPYMHMRRGRKTECIVPAGGLVSALDPVLRASGGTWIAHGAGDADWETVDDQNRVRVPPEDPVYTLRRVALTKEEENGYYYGFANEGLWPLCHIAHTRPVFRPDDWAQYQAANQKFADAALAEIADIENPCVLIQDYHFALLPRLIKEKRPDARVGVFWHIPWPNAEAFGICPWQKQLLNGILGADLVGFQTQFHCNNFLETVDRALESRIDWERFSVRKEGHTTLVKPFPISVAFPEPAGEFIPPDRAALMKELGVKAKYLGVGVERMDYTKGVLERFWAIERFLEKNPSYVGKFVFVQIGAPSRTHIKRYHDFLAEVEAEAERINWKFKGKDYRPIVFLKKHHSHAEIRPYYQAADICLVTSLHDGMNLVAKEFVAAREDDGGALILSRFTGAARDLRDALVVNPYDVDRMADAIRYALEMDEAEKKNRMARLRETVRERNIYRWAGDLIEDLTRIQTSAGAPVV